jgi:predicted DNA-binding transcriptional regulator AlpA
MSEDHLVPDPKARKEFGVSAMTIWRWDRDSKLGFPPPIKINGRTYRSRQQLEEWKANLLARALRRGK